MESIVHSPAIKMTAVLVFIASLAAFYYATQLARRAKKTVNGAGKGIILWIAAASISTFFMTIYHFYDVDWTFDVWKIGTLLIMILTAVGAIYVPLDAKRFSKVR